MMTTKQKRVIFYSVWLLVILSGPYAVLSTTPLERLSGNVMLLLSVIQRITGLLAFVLIGWQIFLGAFMQRFVQIIGAKAYRLHIIQGIGSVLFIFMHPILQSLIDYRIDGVIRSFLQPVFSRPNELYYNFGRIAFIIATITIFVGYFRTKPMFRRLWRKVHILNYIAFYFIFFHAWRLGTDVRIFPLSIVFYLSSAMVTTATLYRIYNYLVSNRLISPSTSPKPSE